jgi:hypothetical protein
VSTGSAAQLSRIFDEPREKVIVVRPDTAHPMRTGGDFRDREGPAFVGLAGAWDDEGFVRSPEPQALPRV